MGLSNSTGQSNDVKQSYLHLDKADWGKALKEICEALEYIINPDIEYLKMLGITQTEIDEFISDVKTEAKPVEPVQGNSTTAIENLAAAVKTLSDENGQTEKQLEETEKAISDYASFTRETTKHQLKDAIEIDLTGIRIPD